MTYYYLPLITFTEIHIRLCLSIFLLPIKTSLIYALRWREIFMICKYLMLFSFPLYNKTEFVKVISHERTMQRPSTTPERSHYKFCVLCTGHFSIFKRQFQGKLQTGTHFWNDFFCLCKPEKKKKAKETVAFNQKNTLSLHFKNKTIFWASNFIHNRFYSFLC